MKPKAKRSRAFVHNPEGPDHPVDKLRFAVLDEAGERRFSAIWSVFPSHNPSKPDLYVTSTGMHGASKFSFHKDVLNHSFLSEKHASLVEQGIVAGGTRHQLSVPIKPLPWFGITALIAARALMKEGQQLGELRGPIIALPRPPEGFVLELGFLLAEGNAVNVNQAHGIIGQVVSGGRALVVVFRISPHDENKFVETMREVLGRAVVPKERAAGAEDAGLSALLYGVENDHIVATELHGLRLVPPKIKGG